MNEIERSKKILKILNQIYPKTPIPLKHINKFTLLVSVLLSAQCTDHRVNQVTKTIFRKYKSQKAFAYADINELAKEIYSCGYHNQKAKSIQGSSLEIVEEYNGIVPDNMEDLVKLPGVGRKTANCVLGEIYGIASMVIDTHMVRIMNLLEFTHSKDAKKIEIEIMEIFDKNDWIKLTHMIIDHGRAVCIARRPQCSMCSISNYCPSVTS